MSDTRNFLQYWHDKIHAPDFLKEAESELEQGNEIDIYTLQQMRLFLAEVMENTAALEVKHAMRFSEEQIFSLYRSQIAKRAALLNYSLDKIKNENLRALIKEFSDRSDANQVQRFQRNLDAINHLLMKRKNEFQQLKSHSDAKCNTLSSMVYDEIEHYQKRGPIYLQEFQQALMQIYSIDHVDEQLPSPQAAVRNIFQDCHYAWALRKKGEEGSPGDILFARQDFISKEAAEKAAEKIAAKFYKKYKKDVSLSTSPFVIHSDNNQPPFRVGIHLDKYRIVTGQPRQSLEAMCRLVQQDFKCTGSLNWTSDQTGDRLLSQPLQGAEEVVSLMMMQSLRAGILPMPGLFSIRRAVLKDGRVTETIAVDLRKIQEAAQLPLQQDYLASKELHAVVQSHVQRQHKQALQTIYPDRTAALTAMAKMQESDINLGLYSAEVSPPYRVRDDKNQCQIDVDFERYKTLLAPTANPDLVSTLLFGDTFTQVEDGIQAPHPHKMLQQEFSNLLKNIQDSNLLEPLANKKTESSERDYYALNQLCILLDEMTKVNWRLWDQDKYTVFIDSISRLTAALTHPLANITNEKVKGFISQFSHYADSDRVQVYQKDINGVADILQTKKIELEQNLQRLRGLLKLSPCNKVLLGYQTLYLMAHEEMVRYQRLGPIYLRELHEGLVQALDPRLGGPDMKNLVSETLAEVAQFANAADPKKNFYDNMLSLQQAMARSNLLAILVPPADAKNEMMQKIGNDRSIFIRMKFLVDGICRDFKSVSLTDEIYNSCIGRISQFSAAIHSPRTGNTALAKFFMQFSRYASQPGQVFNQSSSLPQTFFGARQSLARLSFPSAPQPLSRALVRSVSF